MTDSAPLQDPRDARPAWTRLAVAVLIGTIGSIGMWSFVVALPAVQAGFGATRAEASLPYTLTMVGFAFGGVFMGRLADRFGILPPLLIGAACLGAGYVAGSLAPSLALYGLAQLVVGFGASASFAPIMADLSHWFVKRRGVAVAIASSGNYLAGAIWPPILQHAIAADGWRAAHLAMGAACLVALVPLSFLMRRRAPVEAGGGAAPVSRHGGMDLSQNALLALLVVAGVSCCVAMAMPQVHLVAYCADLGYGPARGAQMLSLMLGFGIVSRLISGFVADRIGGLRTLLAGSFLQGAALFLYVFFDGLTSLYVISALFGLFQGGIVPMYAVIVREFFPAAKAGGVLGVVVMATLVGMALGGWMAGLAFDLTGAYRMAFLNGLAWNLLNVGVCVFLLWRQGGRRPAHA
ncbi:MAG: major facilitator superfamily protein [Hyphomicrobiales bacterium]|nr:major facilitator superfamily protein [Hyphomicrobiales bacterium]